MTDINELERLAKAATPGRWMLVPDDDNKPYAIMVWDDDKDFTEQTKIVECHWGCATERGRADYAYITALSPEVVLALVNVAKAARAQQDAGNHGYHTTASLEIALDDLRDLSAPNT